MKIPLVQIMDILTRVRCPKCGESPTFVNMHVNMTNEPFASLTNIICGKCVKYFCGSELKDALKGGK